MSKSVLVIDTPKKGCGTCIIGHIFMDGDVFCPIEGIIISRKEAESIPDWCPLKPLPEKKEYIIPIDNVESQKDIIAVGWNACIDAITKTSEEKTSDKKQAKKTSDKR